METLVAGAGALGIELDRGRQEKLALYHRVLVCWNRRLNLTSVVQWERARTVHYLDSLTVALALPGEVLEGGSLVDVGAGAGFPGLPLKVAFPGLRVALVESAGKKAAFLERLVAVLGLEDVAVCQGRAEDLARDPALRERFDVAVSRGLARMAVLAELALAFVRPGGLLVAQKKGDVEAEVEEAGPALEAMGGGAPRLLPVCAPGLEDGRVLVVVRKEASTPERYPRRPGVPERRPIVGTDGRA